MTEIFQFFNSTQYQSRNYNAEDFSEMFSTFIQTGLIHVDKAPFLSVLPSNESLQVVLTNGTAMIEGHLYKNTEDKLFPIEPLESSFERIDRLVIRCDNREEYKHIKAFIIKGLPSLNPAPTDVVRTNDVYELSLAQIKVKADNSIELIDERFDTSVCGLASSLFTIPLEDMKEDFSIFKDQLNTDYNNWIQNLERVIDVTDLREELELVKRNQSELLMQRYLEGKTGAGERGYFYDTLSDTKKIDSSNTTAIINTEDMKIDLPPDSLSGRVTFKTHPVGFVASSVKHYHKRPIEQLLEVVEEAYGGSNEIKVKNIEITLTEVN
ncbi:MAG: hypothetical protein RR440_00275 [Erysipelotrichaceae bacterium]